MDVDLIGWVGVGLGGTCGCRCGILCAHMLGVVAYADLASVVFLANKHHHLAIFYSRVF